MRAVAWLAICMAMTGCAMPSAPASHPSLASKSCSQVAQARMNDAAANNIEPALQDIIFRDTYDDCIRWQGKTTGIVRVER